MEATTNVISTRVQNLKFLKSATMGMSLAYAAQVVKWDGISGVTGWSEDPLGSPSRLQPAALIPGIGAGKPPESTKSWCQLSALFCHKSQITAQSM